MTALPSSNRLLLLQYAIYMYLGQIAVLPLSLARKLGLHPVTLAPLADFSVVHQNRYL
jgi:hypothetical protein